VPVLGEDDVGKERRDAMDRFDDRIAFGNGERAAGAEVVLDVDDYENVGWGDGDHEWLQVATGGATGIDYGSGQRCAVRGGEGL
jgi:hypothetical protein